MMKPLSQHIPMGKQLNSSCNKSEIDREEEEEEDSVAMEVGEERIADKTTDEEVC